jgi:hypothetical protein
MTTHRTLWTWLYGVLCILNACAPEQSTGVDDSRHPAAKAADRAVPAAFGMESGPMSGPVLDPNDLDVQGLAGSTQPVRWYYIMDQQTQRWYIVWPSTGAVLLLDRVDRATTFGIYWKPVSSAPSPANQGYPDAGANFTSVSLSPDGRAISFGEATSPSSTADVQALAGSTQPVRWFYIMNQPTGRWYVVSPTTGSVLLLDRVDQATSFGIYWKPVNNWLAQSSPATIGYADAANSFEYVSVALDGSTVYIGPSAAPPPTGVELTAYPATIDAGQATTLTWDAPLAAACGAPWTSSTAPTGSQSVQPTSTTIYTITCTGPGGPASASTGVTVNTTQAKGALDVIITGLPAGVGGLLSITGPTSKSTVAFSTTLNNRTPGVYTIIATDITSGGTTYIPNPTSQQQTVFAGQTTTVSVHYGGTVPPSVTLNANPSVINAGQSSTLSWQSTNATSCGASWTTSSGTSGSKGVSPVVTTTYSLTCTGPGGTRTAGTTISVNTVPNPSVALITTSPTAPLSGQQFSFAISGSNFSSTSAQVVFTGPGCPSTTSCVVPNSVLVTKTGTVLVGPATLTAGSFTVQVRNGAGGTLSNLVTLTVGTAGSSFRLSVFPLPNRTAYSAVINSVFDHSMTATHAVDGVVTAYTGETGWSQFGSNLYAPEAMLGSNLVIVGGMTDLNGYKGSQGTPFVVNGHYSGGVYLYYDGHAGIDYRTIDQASNGQINVLAAAAGTAHVIQGSAYNTIYIDHGNGWTTHYLHLSQRRVSEGAQVQAGQLIGISGSTGATAPHLHFEVQYFGTPVDPYGWLGAGSDPYTRATNRVLW